MCLDNVIKGKEKRKILDSLPETFMVYKLVVRSGRCDYTPAFSCWIRIFAGLNKFKCNMIHAIHFCYRGGSHVLLKRPRQGVWCPDKIGGEKLMSVKINKSDIKTLGYQDGSLVATVSQFIAPNYCGNKE